jgi:two-component system sensor histidine kinase BaeS
MLSPINALANCTREIASLRFNTRIQINSRDELGQLARDFNSMAMTLEKYETLRKQWITDVSHELRTPLSVLQAEIEAIEDGIRDMSGESIRSLHTEINHIIKIVNDLHDLSLADSGTLYFKTESINPVLTLKNTLGLFKTQFDKAGITLVDEARTDGKTIVTADNDRLVQMFSNIFENSLKYTLKPGKLTIRNRTSEEWVRLSIEDSGPGVPDEALPRLFDRLFRVDPSRNRISGGSGLGLSICRNIAETLNGRISARNTGTGGLAIDIDLPLESRSIKRQS